MAKVNLRLRGGPYDGQTVELDVPDANDPPELYDLKLHGAHERVETFEYHRVGREQMDDRGVWIYRAPDV